MITLITGGSGSGKSAYAEDEILSFGEANRIYIATMFPFDEESHRRIARHRAMRSKKNFHTVECYTNLKKLKLEPESVVLLECMSNLVANEMFQEEGAGENTVAAVAEGIQSLAAQARELVIVTNEIVSDGMDYDPETQRYQRYLGEINQLLAQKAGKVVEVVYGIPLVLKERKKTQCVLEQ
ncbi:MAG: bifunctional adenosylcobinamide kinase/adenosylcobinamide-phosphate guanylyltransferase [Lachnospiraceae bacterium]|jgi:adenosylcobinamide kinase/adenosylcobinamide-phosphate guanylyltransferase